MIKRSFSKRSGFYDYTTDEKSLKKRSTFEGACFYLTAFLFIIGNARFKIGPIHKILGRGTGPENVFPISKYFHFKPL